MNNNYTIEDIEPKYLRTNKDTCKWFIGYDNYETIMANPQGRFQEGTAFTATAIAHHIIGYRYYLAHRDDTVGYDYDDCELDEPVVEVEVQEKPNIAAPVLAPSRDVYTIVKPIPGYISPGQAIAGKPETVAGQVESGNYYVFKGLQGAKNVSHSLGVPGFWINPTDNVYDPEPEVVEVKLPDPELVQKENLSRIRKNWDNNIMPHTVEVGDIEITETPTGVITVERELTEPNWRTTYRAFKQPVTGNNMNVMYVAIKNTAVTDLEGKHKDSYLHNGDLISISGTVVYGGEIYGRAAAATERYWWHSVPMDNVDLEENVYGTEVSAADKKVFGTATTHDQVALLLGHVESFIHKRKNKKARQ